VKSSYDVAIIGGGVIGCSIARSLSRYDLDIILLEQGPDVAWGNSRANSGVVHAGYANKPGSMKAQLCVQGNRMFDSFTRELGVPFRRVGKLVVGNGDEGLQGIQRLMKQGEANGIPGLSIISGEDVTKLEPNISADHGMFSASSGITDPVLLTIALAENAHRNGVDFSLESEVNRIRTQKDGFNLITPKGMVRASFIINSAGLYADRISALAGDDRHLIFPCRGEYFVLDKAVGHLISRMVYPVPPKDQRVLGIHLTPTIDGNILIGPSAEFVDYKDDLATTQEVMKQLLKEARDLLPPIPATAVIQSFSGMRPKIHDPSSDKVGDFIIEESTTVPGLINLIGIESPGLTASPSLPPLVIDILTESISLTEKEDWQPRNPMKKRFADMTPRGKAALIREDPDHGQIVCRCEHATKREVLDALNNPLGARSQISVKMRTRATMGRCQGGFCTPRIVEIMQEQGISTGTITLKGKGSKLFVDGDKADNGDQDEDQNGNGDDNSE